MESKMHQQSADQLENEEVLRLFREVERYPAMTQRELSGRLGISLGKVNALINALIGKGFVRVEPFSHSGGKRAYLYYLTPTGHEKKTRTTCLFLEKKIREQERLAREIEQLREEVRKSGRASGQPERRGIGA